MRALFVHGMGRSPISGWPLLWKLRRGGISTQTFWYSTTFADFSTITRRLISVITTLAEAGDYMLIGHSLGGVLLRAAVNALPCGVRRPRHLFLLASPIQPARLAQRLAGNTLYRLITGDCGQLLASAPRMASVGAVTIPTTAIAGTRGWRGRSGIFNGESNDGIVSLTEVSAAWLDAPEQVQTIHTLLPSSRHVGEIILRRASEDVRSSSATQDHASAHPDKPERQ